MKILLVEDDPNFGAFLKDYLMINDFEDIGYEIEMETDGYKKILENKVWLGITEKAKEILAVNKKERRLASLADYVVETAQEIEKTFENVVGQDSLTRFDQPKKKPNNRNKKKKPTTTQNAPTKD